MRKGGGVGLVWVLTPVMHLKPFLYPRPPVQAPSYSAAALCFSFDVILPVNIGENPTETPRSRAATAQRLGAERACGAKTSIRRFAVSTFLHRRRGAQTFWGRAPHPNGSFSDAARVPCTRSQSRRGVTLLRGVRKFPAHLGQGSFATNPRPRYSDTSRASHPIPGRICVVHRVSGRHVSFPAGMAAI